MANFINVEQNPEQDCNSTLERQQEQEIWMTFSVSKEGCLLKLHTARKWTMHS
jgi:hypothetical protein